MVDAGIFGGGAQIKAGYLADILLVDGNPIADITILQDHTKLLGIMKDGHFHKDPGTGTQGRPSDIALDELVGTGPRLDP